MTTPLRIRIDEPCYAKAMAFFIENGVEIVAKCYDKPRDENPHYHLYALSSASLDALRRRRSRHFRGDDSMVGNGAMSIAPMGMPEEYKAYMCKGSGAYKEKGQWSGKSDPVIDIYDTTIFDKSVEEYHNDFWNSRVEFKKPRSRSKPWVELVVERWVERFKPDEVASKILKAENDYLTENEFEDLSLDLMDTIEFVMEQYHRDIKPYDMLLVSRLCNLIYFKYQDAFGVTASIRKQKFKEGVLHLMISMR